MQSNANIDQVLRQKSDAKEIPGVVAIAADSKELIYQGAFGKRDLSKDDSMTPDSVFWIASMTKAITAAALASALVEVAQVRYSRSAMATGSRRPNHDLDPTASSANACATLSTAPNEYSAPVPA